MNPFLADLEDKVGFRWSWRCLRVAVLVGLRHFLYFKLPSVPTFQTLTYY